MSNKMGTEPIAKLIIKMALPATLSMLISALYNIIDTIYVSRLGEYALTSVSLVMPLYMIIIGVGVGTGIGMNSFISRRLGEGKPEEAAKCANHSIPLGLVLGLIFAVLGIIFTPMFVGMYTEDPLVYSNASMYNYIITVGSFSVLILLGNEKLIQGTGNMVWPMIFALIGTVANIILDPIMIFGLLGFPAMGVTGAALATVIGQGLAMAFSVYILIKRGVGVKITLKKFRFDFKIVYQIYAVGLPAIIMQCIGSLTVMLMNGILISFTPTAVTVLGLHFRIQSFVIMPVIGICQGAMPIMGFNFGARNKTRLFETVKTAMIFSTALMVLGTAIMWIFPAQLLGIFEPSPEALAIGIPAMRGISFGYIFVAAVFVLSNLYQASGMGYLSMIASLLRQIVFVIPMAFIFAEFIGLNGVWYAFPIADFFALLITTSVFIFLYRKRLDKHLAQKPDDKQEPPTLEPALAE